MKINLLKLKLLIAAKTILYVLANYRYGLLFVASLFITAGLLVWSINLDLLAYILFDAPITIVEKTQFIARSYTTILSSPDARSTSIVLFSLLSGLNTTVFVFAFRRRYLKSPNTQGALGAVFAVLSGGCYACGTSLLAPLFTSVGAVSIQTIARIGVYINWIGIVLIAWSLYTTVMSASSVVAEEKYA